ncbi:hypothetical protein T552_02957 [Pneumocystis carinii B80]|uniref:Uncharacterized protein n=1 Tax=Pneumocystis carinii (strain B80) TaxID=1408658 RepID=A0A0W4ZDL1_PNEC8|nr:hypothetical protein T552_02957 [Pneumocystis carinii B80]KTW26476.1 hypothetical protein T552_02957 [Pneumocystis carinii B80]
MRWQGMNRFFNVNQVLIGIEKGLIREKCSFIYKNIRCYSDIKAPDTSINKSRPSIVVSSFRGGFLGFFIGTSLASAVGYYYLINEYQYASNTLLLSIEELQHVTDSIIKRVKQVEKIEKDLKKIQDSAITKSDLENVQVDTKKMFESLNLAQLEANERFSELEMDVAKLSRQARTII